MAAVALSTKAVGSIVKIKENGTAQEFYVAKHNYVSGRTLLVRRYIYNKQNWSVKYNQVYGGGTIDTWLTGSYLSLFPSDIQGNITAVSIALTTAGGTTEVGTLSRKIFLLSFAELGQTSNANVEGAALASAALNVLKIAYDSAGTAQTQWSRSLHKSSGGYALYMTAAGGASYAVLYTASHGVRPAFTLPGTILVDDSGNITTNTAPTVPSSITIPSTVNGGTTITISWGTSTDAQSNLAGYKVERSLNGGSWSQIYQGTATSTTNAVAFGSSTVAYRVKAYDTEGLESTYQTSATRTVINNVAPTNPGSISVPTTVIGGSTLIITWAASTDSDGNLSGYILQRSTDGGTTYTQAYKGSALSFVDAISKGWESVRYRVQAYDANGAASGYATSPVRTVDNTVAPAISSDTSGGIGEKSEGFEWTYTVTQADDEATTVTEKIDGATLRSYTVTLGRQETFSVADMDFMTLLNGNHTMTVTATALNGKSATYTVAFTKGVYALSITLAEPMDADALIAKMVQNIQRSIPADATFTVLVTNNAKDASPAWEDATTSITGGHNYIFTNQTAANGSAFNFRITASRGARGGGGFISSIGGAFE